MKLIQSLVKQIHVQNSCISMLIIDNVCADALVVQQIFKIADRVDEPLKALSGAPT